MARCRNEVFYVRQGCDCKRSQPCLFHGGLAFDVSFFHLPFHKGRFKRLHIGQNALHVGQHDFLQRHRSNEMGGAGSRVAAVVAAVEEVLVGGECVGGAVLQLGPTGSVCPPPCSRSHGERVRPPRSASGRSSESCPPAIAYQKCGERQGRPKVVPETPSSQ